MTITQAKIVIPLKNSSFERSRVEDDIPLEEAATACLITSMSKYFKMHTHAPNSKALSDVKHSKVNMRVQVWSRVFSGDPSLDKFRAHV